MFAGVAATLFSVAGGALILFPLVSSAILAIGALGTSLMLAGYAVARRRRRRDSDAR